MEFDDHMRNKKIIAKIRNSSVRWTQISPYFGLTPNGLRYRLEDHVLSDYQKSRFNAIFGTIADYNYLLKDGKRIRGNRIKRIKYHEMKKKKQAKHVKMHVVHLKPWVESECS